MVNPTVSAQSNASLSTIGSGMPSLGANNSAQAKLTFTVSNTNELKQALNTAKRSTAGATILLEDGIYPIKGRSLVIKQDHITIRSASGQRDNVIITGEGMTQGVGNLIDVSADHFSLIGVTLQNSKWHLIQIRSEKDADYFFMDNCVLQDAGQQIIKVSHSKKVPYHSNNGMIQNSLFQYTAGIGPYYYIGGVDAHRAIDWVVKNNIFKDISSPGKKVAEHAIHFWNDSRNTQSTGNIIINSDRGIGYGMYNRENQHYGGLIADNVIIHTKADNPFADTGIILESSPNTVVKNNVLYMTTSYPNAIEYRFEHTKNVVIEGNITNKAIKKRNGAEAILINNQSGSKSLQAIDTIRQAIK